MTERELIREAMRLLGSRTSERKKASSRVNARKSWTPEARKKRLEAGRSSPTSEVRRFAGDSIKISGLLDVLTFRGKTIIFQRFGLEDGEPKTLEEIGKKFGITRERIRQLQNIALSKLRNAREARSNPT